jgi:5'-deoxynucleotidase YfbR-like HD superfamily hydrolase
MSESVDTFGCVRNTIKVSAGHYVDFMNPDPATIEISSVAAGLSKICRFGGQCPQFYSVAEHCIHATALAVSDGLVGDVLRAVFLHDAAEAYIGDMVKPLKVMMPEYAVVERRMEAAIEKAFGVEFLRWENTIKFFDRAMLKAEKTTMWPNDAEEWEGFSEIEDRDVPLRFWRPDQAEWQFLAMAKTLHLI